MMKSIQLTKDGDLKLEGNSFIMIDNESEVLQSITSLLKVRLEEFYLDEHIGLERKNLLGKNFNADEARDDLIECISQDDRIEVINDLTITILGRVASIFFEAKLISTEYEANSTITGEVQLSV